MNVCIVEFVRPSAIGVFLLGLIAATNCTGAPPKPVSESKSIAASDELPAEIPAVPYVLLGLIRDSAIHQELQLTSPQINAVRQAILDVDQRFWQLRDVPVERCSQELERLSTRLRSNLDRDLSSSQMKRLDQIILQVRSWRAVVSAEVADYLKLTPDQNSKLKTLLAGATRARQEGEKKLEAVAVADRPAARARMLKAETRQFMDVLSRNQQTALGELLGKPFDMGSVTVVGCEAPEFRGVSAWINSRPLSLNDLRGKVVVVHFWAFGCINCIRNLPHYQAWHDKFAGSGLTVIGIQTPETAAERSLESLKHQVLERKIDYPVAFDSESTNWKEWGNNMWPSVYLIDKQGRVRNWWYGELNWQGATGEEFLRKRIEALLAEK